MTDEIFLAAFENTSLPRHEWTHAAHVRMGFLYLSRLPYAEAEASIVAGIRRFNAAKGNPTGYHQTITIAFARLIAARTVVEANHVYLILDFSTGNAAGQNMVTVATQAILDHILNECPTAPRRAYIEANLSGDKKACAQSLLLGRGRSVTADVIIPPALLLEHLRITPRAMENYFHLSAIGAALSGAIGAQGHYANGLAALFIACGQDVACVAESAVGMTRFEEREDGSLYASVTVPNLVVGTVGGGTGLPSQRACLDLLGLGDVDTANEFAELCAAVVLAGELSIVGAIVANEFTRAHVALGRRSQ